MAANPLSACIPPGAASEQLDARPPILVIEQELLTQTFSVYSQSAIGVDFSAMGIGVLARALVVNCPSVGHAVEKILRVAPYRAAIATHRRTLPTLLRNLSHHGP